MPGETALSGAAATSRGPADVSVYTEAEEVGKPPVTWTRVGVGVEFLLIATITIRCGFLDETDP